MTLAVGPRGRDNNGAKFQCKKRTNATAAGVISNFLSRRAHDSAVLPSVIDIAARATETELKVFVVVSTHENSEAICEVAMVLSVGFDQYRAFNGNFVLWWRWWCSEVARFGIHVGNEHVFFGTRARWCRFEKDETALLSSDSCLQERAA